jgi:hypothetical protein
VALGMAERMIAMRDDLLFYGRDLRNELGRIIKEKLLLNWSPERISGYLRLNGFLISKKSLYKMEQMNLFNENPSEKQQKKKLHDKITFKEYQQEQMMLPTYLSEIRVYEAEDFSGCPFHDQCTKSQGNRKIRFNPRLEELKTKVRSNLTSEKGLKLRSQRSVEVESVFGRIKSNWGFRRFLLRGLEKVNIEWGLLSIAHNMAKMAVVSMN